MTELSSRAWVLAVAMICATTSTPSALAQSASDLSTCGGGAFTGYIGQPYKRLQKIKPDARYVCSTCPMTMDFRQDRLTVTFDRRTKRIKTLRCV